MDECGHQLQMLAHWLCRLRNIDSYTAERLTLCFPAIDATSAPVDMRCCSNFFRAVVPLRRGEVDTSATVTAKE